MAQATHKIFTQQFFSLCSLENGQKYEKNLCMHGYHISQGHMESSSGRYACLFEGAAKHWQQTCSGFWKEWYSHQTLAKKSGTCLFAVPKMSEDDSLLWWVSLLGAEDYRLVSSSTAEPFSDGCSSVNNFCCELCTKFRGFNFCGYPWKYFTNENFCIYSITTHVMYFSTYTHKTWDCVHIN